LNTKAVPANDDKTAPTDADTSDKNHENHAPPYASSNDSKTFCNRSILLSPQYACHCSVVTRFGASKLACRALHGTNRIVKEQLARRGNDGWCW
jgi:hypothetical protein